MGLLLILYDGFSSAFDSISALAGQVSSLQLSVAGAKSELRSFETASAKSDDEFRLRLKGVSAVANEAKVASTRAERVTASLESTGLLGDFASIKSKVLSMDHNIVRSRLMLMVFSR